jgi:3'-phosphoadenosine 5'-phosphosulfate sulfotransferase (PAPS reductase)/FAD synthetase
MESLSEKVAYSKDFVSRCVSEFKKPAIMCSFGKDSMVMLHIIKDMGLSLPVVFHRDPWFPQKYKFADSIISDWGLEVYDYPPSKITLWEGEEIMAFTNHYQIGKTESSYLQLPKNIITPERDRKWICGIDLLNRPKSSFDYPWDLVFIGHKDSDKDQIAGSVNLHVDLKKNGGIAPDGAFPLRCWTDSDVWQYSDTHNIPQQWDRYDKESKKELPDKYTNSDYANVCINCINSRETKASVNCPKIDMQVSNIAHLAPYNKPQFNYFGGGK